MHARAWLVSATLVASITLAGCFGSSSSKSSSSGTGTSTTQAAEALTKAVSFENGELVSGLIPPDTAMEVSLLPSPSDPVSPGDDALMSFDVENPDDANAVELALIQFDPTSEHFEVTPPASDAGVADAGAADAGRSDAGPGDAGAPRKVSRHRFNLGYKIKADVCAKLCDTTFAIKVKQAVKLKDGKISKTALATITLDCTATGDHTYCGKTSSSTMSDAAVAAAIVNGYIKLQTSACMCVATASAGNPPADAGAGNASGYDCNVKNTDAPCATKAFTNHVSMLGDQLSCMQKYLAEGQTCIDAAKCDTTKVAACDVLNNRLADGGKNDPLTTACGAFPAPLQTELDACGGGNSGKIATFACNDNPSQVLMQSQLCDGKMDCKDGIDEMVCLTCKQPSSQRYTIYQHCDGTPSCKDGSDETSCTFACLDKSGNVPFVKLCNGTPDCKDGSDEACTGATTSEFPCGDGKTVPLSKYCDGTGDCASGFDEAQCPTKP